jgi:hypothetical protein
MQIPKALVAGTALALVLAALPQAQRPAAPAEAARRGAGVAARRRPQGGSTPMSSPAI